MKTDVDRYLALDYPIELHPDRENGGFVAMNPDLPGCITQAETAGEAVETLERVRRHWIELRIEKGLPVPEPVSHEFSGKVLLRMSTALHSQAAQLAARRGVSLNLLINTALADYIGHTDATAQLSREIGDLRKSIHDALAETLAEVRQQIPAQRTIAARSFDAKPDQAYYGGGKTVWMMAGEDPSRGFADFLNQDADTVQTAASHPSSQLRAVPLREQDKGKELKSA